MRRPRNCLPRIVIKEDVKPDRITLETERMSGIMIGAGFEVRYHVRAPKNAVVNMTNTQRTGRGQRVVGQSRGAHDQRRGKRHQPDRRRRRTDDQRQRVD